jgi:hypothetical protein
MSWIVLGLLATGLLLACVLAFPQWLYPSFTRSALDSEQLAGKERIDAVNDRLRLQNDARTTLLQGLGGSVLLLGAYFTWRQLRHSVESGREQHELDRQGQITERFTRAVDQLGSPSLDVRLGGLYALERIARDSEEDRGPIAEILAAYTRVHAALPSDDARQLPPPDPVLPWLRNRAADLQAALYVLGRRPPGHEAARLDISRVDLRRSYLRDARLVLIRCRDATLAGSWLAEADLSDSDLTRTDLRGVSLKGACLRGARLQEADLRGADLTAADLRGAIADAATAWPERFDWRAAGVHLEGEEPA